MDPENPTIKYKSITVYRGIVRLFMHITGRVIRGKKKNLIITMSKNFLTIS